MIDFIGAPGEARTPDLLIRSLTGLGYIIDSFRGGHLVSPSPAASSALIEPEIEHAFRALSNAVIPSPMVLSGAADRLALLPRVCAGCAAEIEQKPLLGGVAALSDR
ncbi:MAG: hypothetical protein ACRD45_18950 [Bryobacteraceae bacterium]